MTTVIHLLIGVFACLVFILIARQAGLKREPIIYATGLVVAALIYVGFAAAGGAARSWIGLELGGLALFLLIAFLGLRISVLFLALGWAAHAVWDVLLHHVLEITFMPEWYPIACTGFDLLLAGYITIYKRGPGTLTQAALQVRPS